MVGETKIVYLFNLLWFAYYITNMCKLVPHFLWTRPKPQDLLWWGTLSFHSNGLDPSPSYFLNHLDQLLISSDSDAIRELRIFKVSSFFINKNTTNFEQTKTLPNRKIIFDWNHDFNEVGRISFPLFVNYFSEIIIVNRLFF